MRSFGSLFALAAGALLPIQAAVNVQLRRSLDSPISAAIISFVIGGIGLALFALLTRVPIPAGELFGKAPWWAWLGGLLGAIYVGATILLTPKIGVGTMIAMGISGQLVMAVALDHFGVLGLTVHPATWPRIVGVVLLLTGAFLIQRN